MDDAQLEAGIRSHAFAANLRSSEHGKEAEKAAAAKEADQRGHHGITPENRQRLDWQHDRKIDDHTRQAKSWAEVSLAAGAGYLLHRPSQEGMDSAYTKQHSDLISTARRSGRLVDQMPDVDGGEEEEGKDCPCNSE